MLRSYLDPNHPDYQPEQQHINIKAAIRLYEDGEIDGMKQVYIKNGKIVPREEIFKEGKSSSKIERFSLKKRFSKEVGPYVRECFINLPKSMLMAMGPLVKTFPR